jgi:phage shock protein PspC (stress-responsive transcriptional regulator)
MPFSDTNVFARDDTFFGVCQALGEDLGFNPNYLRIGFALPLLYAPVATLAVYAALAVVVLLLRVIVPNPRRASTEESAEPASRNESATGTEDVRLPLAA